MPVQQRKKVRHSPSYYKRMRKQYEEGGMSQPLLADTTRKAIDVQLGKVRKYCGIILFTLYIFTDRYTVYSYCTSMKLDYDAWFRESNMADIKTYRSWVLDNYPKMSAISSFKNGWCVLRMYMLRNFGREFSNKEQRDVLNVSS
jgi:hypothetical protein